MLESYPIRVEFTCLTAVNFAMQQNRVAIIRSFSIENTGEQLIENLTVTIKSEPEFAEPLQHFVAAVAPHETLRIEGLQLNLSTAFFSQLTERMAAGLSVEIAEAEKIVFKKVYPIDILAFDQWAGINVLPEMLSAFVTPNHPALTPVIKRAAVLLQEWTGNSALDEYQSRNPNRVRQQMAAVFAAIAELNIVYCTPPAGFEKTGQRIRLVDNVLTQKIGTCLDMALLYASCLEAIGINPIIMIFEGHAVAGGWLIPETFPDSIIDDPAFLNKRAAQGINEITIVETTCLNQGNTADFDHAESMSCSNRFVFALDVKRSRAIGIKPLPQRILNGSLWEFVADASEYDVRTIDKPQIINPYDLSSLETKVDVTKQLIWERKLLDLSLRNNLLNIRLSAKVIQLVTNQLASFEDAMADGNEFTIMPKSADFENPPQAFGLYHNTVAHELSEFAQTELSQKRLRTYLTEAELLASLKALYRASRLSIEENGANTLYIALGLLEWYETPSSERPRYAPILLLPVEILRKSAAQGFVVRARDEDTMLNITLFEMLRQNFGITIAGLDPLPVDENGVDIKLTLSIIRQNIKNQSKWDVNNCAMLGIFSFNKFIMWNDIHNNSQKLSENKIVASLISGKLEWQPPTAMPDAATLDRELKTTELLLPIGADSSQLEAVHAALNDNSYILHGPPGTGKSQTITNIIANALYHGKRVLFVAEKMAALSVVQNRLKTIGLAPFCLELHSNKVQKSAVLAQLKACMEAVKQQSPSEFRHEAERMQGLRVELNRYIDALHTTQSFGLSLYDAITRYLSIETPYEPVFPATLFNGLTENTVKTWHEALEMTVGVGRACGHPHGHPFSETLIADYSASLKDDIAASTAQALEFLKDMRVKIEAASPLLNLPAATGYDREQTAAVCAVVAALLQTPELTPALLTQPRLNDVLDEYRAAIPHGRARDQARNAVTACYTAEALNVPAAQWRAEWNAASHRWFIPRFFGQRSIKKRLAAFASPQTTNIVETLSQIVNYQNEKEILSKTPQIAAFFGKFGKTDNEDWDAVEQTIDCCKTIHTQLLIFTKDSDEALKIKTFIAQQLSDGIETYRSLKGAVLSGIDDAYAKWDYSEKRLIALLGLAPNLFHDGGTQWIDKSVERLTKWINNIDRMKDWYQWLIVRNKLNELQIGFIAETCERDNIPIDDLLNVFDKSFNKAAVMYIVGNDRNLQLFQGKLFNEVIDRYRRLIVNFEGLVRREIYARLAANIPAFTAEAAQSSEVGILQRNIKNNARGTSIRKLFDQIPTLLRRMCPCMLMSPLSVAQYIDPSAEPFDLVVFDEASQMPTSEAVGAIARGKHAVVVGDPKQMPPTSFFTVGTIDEDNINMEDLESILDDCLALSMPSKHLLWHYRSKHESLIAFSNTEYYDNKLFTFPSPDNIESKVRFVPVAGFYDKGKSRQNRDEARAVVAEVERRLSDPELQRRSIGIVTFSSVQQSLIEDVLFDLFTTRPDLETIAMERDEPLFIKNLENVQGDERDIILFSVGYGPDRDGHVSMNFGPLNREGGERRLNVAVSRARYEMIIYSTLKPDMIDLNRSSAVGVAGLKRFLEYAQRGQRMVAESNTITTTNAIEQVIAKALRNKGYTVHTNIGCSGYRIDVGIVNPDEPTRYLIGLLCDGNNYRQAKTARDREFVQPNALRMLGWQIFRVWTLDWWENPQKTLDIIINEIEKAKNHIVEENNVNVKQNDTQPINVKPDETPSGTIASSPIASSTIASGPAASATVSHLAPNAISSLSAPYKSANLQFTNRPSEDFYSPLYQRLIMTQLMNVVIAEAPVSRQLLFKRVLNAWGIRRITSKIEKYLTVFLANLPYYKETTADGAVFVWESEAQYTDYNSYRPQSERDALDLPPVEVAVAMRELLKAQISLPVADFLRITAQAFGFARMGTNLETAMQRGLAEAQRRVFVKMEGERVCL